MLRCLAVAGAATLERLTPRGLRRCAGGAACLGAAHAGGASDQAARARAGQRARRRLASSWRMTARLAISLHAVSVRRGRQMGAARHHPRPRAGGRWALVGANGSGKTQLLKVLAGDVWPTPTGSGSARLPARPARGRSSSRRSARIAYLGASCRTNTRAMAGISPCAICIATGLHGTDLLLAPGHRRRASADRRDACAPAASTALAARQLLHRCHTGRSGSRCWRARCAEAPDWLLLDEFYNGLDASYRGAHRSGARASPRAAAAPGSWRRIAPSMCRAARAA